MKQVENAKEENEVLQKSDVSRQKKASRSRRSSVGPYVVAMLGCVAVVLLIVYLALVLGKPQDDEQGEDIQAVDNIDITYTQEEMDAILAEAVAQAVAQAKEEEASRILGGLKQNFEKGDSTALALREFFPDQLVIASDGRIRFYPILEELSKNNYLQENLKRLESGEFQYVENGEVISHKGIDVSSHQGIIDWKQVAEDGVEFAFIRVAFRGYGTGKIVIDEQFENNIKGALSNGIKVGVYFYSQSINEEEALEEANIVLEQIAPYRITGPVVYDAEKMPDARTSNLKMEERTAMTLSFCKAVEEAGYRPMIYLNMDVALTAVDLTQLEDYDKWFAHYTTEIYYPYDYKIWQYSEKGTIKGINKAVDLNIGYEIWE